MFESKLHHVNNIDLAIDLIDYTYLTQRGSQPLDSFEYMISANSFVAKMFFHGNSEFSIRDNWICYILGKTVWSHFNSIVSPDDVMKHSSAMCS